MKLFKDETTSNSRVRILVREPSQAQMSWATKVTRSIIISTSSLNKFITITCLLNMSHFKSGKSCPKPEINICHMPQLPPTKLALTLITIQGKTPSTILTILVQVLIKRTEFPITWVSMEFRGLEASKISGIKTHMVTQAGRAIPLCPMLHKAVNWCPNKYPKRSVAWRKNPRCP